MTDLPYAGAWVLSVELYQWSNWRKLIATDVVNGEEWQNILNSGTWTGWVRIATAKPPKEHPLPLAAGVSNSATGASRYSKDQLGRVLIHVGVKLPQMAGNHLIAALPSGYRPAEGGASAVFIDASNSRAISSWILSDGNLWVYCPQEISSASGQIEFIAMA